ncbi:MAG: hypothetical protein QOJ91_1513 [Sphingomonadales bacterium]|jgi:hypothetical protein|nr:hypothetical protein [Sphingomonadales bacterium]
MHSATIPLAALATFAGVFWLTPAPVAQQAQPSAVVEVAAPRLEAVEASRARVAPAAAKRSTVRRSRPAARPRPPAATIVSAVRPAGRAWVYFPGCNEVRAAGLAPLYRGEPGYRVEMDGDRDGIACEPHRRRG